MEEYQITTITLEIEKDTSLAILLHSDGTINRKGDGSYNIDKNIFMGMTDTTLFQNLMQYVTEDFKKFLGNVYDLPDKEGKNCSVEIVLEGEKEGNGMKFNYGADSMGPPKPVADFVEAAIRLTDPWFYKQQAMINKQKPQKKWWQFWKK